MLSEDVKFANSRKYIGLQLVDILASAVRRACQGHLQFEGWQNLGKLMVQNADKNSPLHYVALHEFSIDPKRLKYNEVFRHCYKTCKAMLVKD